MRVQGISSWKRNLSYTLSIGIVLSNILGSASAFAADGTPGRASDTTTPIRHLVVIVQENETFDHYFGTYPHAANIPGETSWVGVPAPKFVARGDTPSVNGLPDPLLTNNATKSKTGVQINPIRLTPASAFTCDMNHGYTAEQAAVNSGLVDQYPASTAGTGEGCATDGSTVMNYFDGNTVTALWNYAQNFSMSDNSYGTNYGPTLPGHINLVSGNTHGAILHNATSSGSAFISPKDGSVTMIGNLPAFLDDCGSDKGGTVKTAAFEMTSKNIGDALNAANISWGYFAGGFAPTQPAVLNADGSTKTPAVCGSAHNNHQVAVNGQTYSVANPTTHFTSDIHGSALDYSNDVIQPFMYYASTRNPHHLRPSSVAAIGTTDQANHQYDSSDFLAALQANNLPAVSFLKPPSYQWGHPGNSDPLTEQAWLVQMINAIQQSPDWSSTAIVIAWDDSDGWYDHVLPPVVSPSNISSDRLAGPGNCGTPAATADQGRCGFGPRLPLLVVSPWAKTNYVDHSVTDQSSVLAFIEDNWKVGFMDGSTTPPEGTGSTDRTAGSLNGMFDFSAGPHAHKLILDPITGIVADNH
jgi:phospholipase C